MITRKRTQQITVNQHWDPTSPAAFVVLPTPTTHPEIPWRLAAQSVVMLPGQLAGQVTPVLVTTFDRAVPDDAAAERHPLEPDDAAEAANAIRDLLRGGNPNDRH